MTYLWLTDNEGAKTLLEFVIRVSLPLVLTFVFRPGAYEEGLEIAVFGFDVMKDSPL